MKITKFGHCCLLIEENGLRIITDPGAYTTKQNDVKNIDVILITHEHPDHIHIDSLKTILNNSPEAKVVTNKAVAELLKSENIGYELIGDTETKSYGDVIFEAFEEQHAVIYTTMPRVLNTGFFIGNKLFYPGDALIQPNKDIDVLACPVAGPWIKVSEAVDYAKLVKPKKMFPVHDGGLSSNGLVPTYRISKVELEKENIEVIIPELNEEFEV